MKVVIIFKNKKNYSGGALPAEALTGSAFVCYSHFCFVSYERTFTGIYCFGTCWDLGVLVLEIRIAIE